MPDRIPKLHQPWLVAAWPGMGNVAVSAAYYLMAKLEMYQLAEFPARDLFDLDYISVKKGLVLPGHRPRSRLFVWTDPNQNHDIIVFIGEAQPPTGKHAFCSTLIDFAQQLGMEKVFTFAAMATEMNPRNDSRVFAAATDEETLPELRRLELELLEEGQISGLNGALLAVAAEHSIPGVCLLGEMPHFFAQLPFPKASVAVLEAFTAMARIQLDLSELIAQSESVDRQLGDLLSEIEQVIKQHQGEEPPGEEITPPVQAQQSQIRKSRLAREDRERIETLFKEVSHDRSRAFELKAELDRLHVFGEYEDRFLDLFKEKG